MLENEVNNEENHCKDNCGAHNKQSRTLKLAPAWPSHLFGELRIRLFAIVNELSHLYF